MIQAVLFDLDDTLYHYDTVNKLSYNAVELHLAKVLGKERETVVEAIKQARNELHIDCAGLASSHSRLLYFQKATEHLVGRTMPALTLLCEELFWTTFLDNIKCFVGVEKYFRYLKSRGIKIVIVTDLTAQIQLRKIIQLGLESYIDFMVTSEEAGVEKPSPEMFLLALKKLSLRSDEVLMVGDSHDKDILGAKNNSIKAFKYDSSLSDFSEFVKNLGL